jgi:hypothetical protein
VGSIYRFERSIQRFCQLVDERALTFVLPAAAWPDENEGFLFRAVQSQEGQAKVLKALQNVFPKTKGHGLAIGLLKAFRQGHYAQCWSKCPENDALWRGYQVRIEVDRDDISKLDGIKAHDVRYVNSIDLEEELKLVFTHIDEEKFAWRPENVLLIKRTQFSHEQEVRLLTKIIDENVVNRTQPWVAVILPKVFHREYLEGKITKEEFERNLEELKKIIISTTRKVSFAHIPNFIRSVMLHPHLPNEIDRQMARFCTQHSLNYLGKSRMYKFNL